MLSNSLHTGQLINPQLQLAVSVCRAPHPSLPTAIEADSVSSRNSHAVKCNISCQSRSPPPVSSNTNKWYYSWVWMRTQSQRGPITITARHFILKQQTKHVGIVYIFYKRAMPSEEWRIARTLKRCCNKSQYLCVCFMKLTF